MQLFDINQEEKVKRNKRMTIMLVLQTNYTKVLFLKIKETEEIKIKCDFLPLVPNTLHLQSTKPNLLLLSSYYSAFFFCVYV